MSAQDSPQVSPTAETMNEEKRALLLLCEQFQGADDRER